MKLPATQDVVLDTLGWTTGPLPNADLEHIAWLLFSHKYPETSYTNALCSVERDECRRLALRIRVKCVQMDRWTIEDAHSKLADQLQTVIFGDRRLGKTIRQELLDYCETFIADAWGHFGRRLFYQRDVEANNREIAAEMKEDANGNRD